MVSELFVKSDHLDLVAKVLSGSPYNAVGISCPVALASVETTLAPLIRHMATMMMMDEAQVRECLDPVTGYVDTARALPLSSPDSVRERYLQLHGLSEKLLFDVMVPLSLVKVLREPGLAACSDTGSGAYDGWDDNPGGGCMHEEARPFPWPEDGGETGRSMALDALVAGSFGSSKRDVCPTDLLGERLFCFRVPLGLRLRLVSA